LQQQPTEPQYTEAEIREWKEQQQLQQQQPQTQYTEAEIREWKEQQQLQQLQQRDPLNPTGATAGDFEMADKWLLSAGTNDSLVCLCVSVCGSVLQCIVVCCGDKQQMSAGTDDNLSNTLPQQAGVQCTETAQREYTEAEIREWKEQQQKQPQPLQQTGMCVAVCCSILQCVAACCSVVQGVAVCCGVLQRPESGKRSSRRSRIRCSRWVCVLQCVVVCCSVLQQTSMG